ncbi:MAG: hypothetical protein IJ192_00820 [Clostridia bacterium]|nr:hypothetical protein [Clostridia bacterium]
MKYFTDKQIQEMRERIKAAYGGTDSILYLAYLSKIEALNKRYDEFGDCREELMQAIAEMERATEQYVHRGKADPNDEDADAYEYENYDFRQTMD